MNWLQRNRLSAKDPLGSPAYNLTKHSSSKSGQKPSHNVHFPNPYKIKSNPSFSLQESNSRAVSENKPAFSRKINSKKEFKLPSLNKDSTFSCNPEESLPENSETIYYQSQIFRALKTYDQTYMMKLARQHFQQTISALRITKNFKVLHPRKEIKLAANSKFKKTVYLDLDETLIHTDEHSQKSTVKLTFPIETGGSIQAGVHIRPYCREFLEALSQIVEVIIFTASSSSYANVILDHLDPDKKYFSHRLYRQHCTLQKGFYVKDLRAVNRKIQDVVIVDNSAFSFCIHPENGIPILPFYHFRNDRELEALLPFLQQVVDSEDCRQIISKTFFWDAYTKEYSNPQQIFHNRFKKNL